MDIGQKRVLLALFALACICMGIAIWNTNGLHERIIELEQADTVGMEVKKEKTTDTFAVREENQTYAGSLELLGFVREVKRDTAFCTENCESVDYVFFEPVGEMSEVLRSYLETQEGNSYAGDGLIGLGCRDGDLLWRMNDSDQYGMQRYTTELDESQAILKSTKESPVWVRIRRYVYTSGRGAPDCYSHFAEVQAFGQ